MNICFRSDASTIIGTGHIIRCLTLSDELRERGLEVRFICQEVKGDMIGFIKESGYSVDLLPSNIDMETDKELTLKILKNYSTPSDLLIVDHYSIDFSWESCFRTVVNKIMVIDDLADRTHNCDILLDQNFRMHERRYEGLVPAGCIELIGPKYALLRPQFLEARRHLKECNKKVERILIFMGGSDIHKETQKVLKTIQKLDYKDVMIDVVVGASNTHLREIETLASTIQNVECHFHVENMAELMVAADLCVGAGGTATWERCCIGLPSLVIVVVENQVNITENLAKDDVIVNLGWHENVNEEYLMEEIENVVNDFEKRKKMNGINKEIVDGMGVKRVANEIFKLAF